MLCLPDHPIAVPDREGAFPAVHDFQLSIERRRLQQPHGERVGCQCGNESREIPSVGRARRSAKASRYGDGFHLANDTRCCAARHSANPISAAHKDVSLSVSSDPLANGARAPNTTAEITIETQDCTDAADPRALGNRSSIRSERVGDTNCTPTAITVINSCCTSSGGILINACRATVRVAPISWHVKPH